MPDTNRPGSLSARLAASTVVLGVEDDADIAEFLRAYFRASGYGFIHLDPDDPDDVLTALAEHRPDCLLLDMGLRGFSGLDVYRRLRSRDAWRFLPVVVVTADITAEPRARAAASGIDAFVSKPFNADTLAEVVGGCIEAARRLAEKGEPLDEPSGVLTATVLEARLADEIGLARAVGRPLAFALVTLRGVAAVRSAVGGDGLAWLVRDLVTRALPLMPADASLGRTEDDELALLAPGLAPAEAARLLTAVLGQVRGSTVLPGGAEVVADPVAGVAGFPAHAVDPPGLFMAADAALSNALEAGDAVAVAL